jgi:hypothetical protein
MTAIMSTPTVAYRWEFRLPTYVWEGTTTAPDCYAAMEQMCRAIAGRIAKREKVPAENLLRAGHFVFRRLP